MKLKELIKPLILKKEMPDSSLNLIIERITQDTREVEDGALFICIKGFQTNGHDVAQEAVDNGATAIIASEPITVSVPVVYVKDTMKAMAIIADIFYDSPSKKMKMIGVTGTNGKTTTTLLLDQIFRDHKESTGVIGTMYRRVVDKVYETKNTTPDIITTQRTLNKMVKSEVTFCSMEVSSHSLVQGRVWGLDFDVAIFTNLSQDHLEYHHTMQAYAEAKSLLFSQLGNGYNHQSQKLAVINVDDPYGRSYFEKIAAPVITYGMNRPADFKAENLLIEKNGTAFTLLFQEEKYDVKLNLVGKFNVMNALAAIAGAYAAGRPLEDIIQSLERVEGVRGRFELVPTETNFSIIVDYAHTPDGLENVLKAANEIKVNNVISVVGCGGDRDPSKRSIMADVSINNSDISIFTSDNPRTEDPDTILDEMTRHLNQNQFIRLTDRREAINKAVQLAESGDVILIAGKGHEDYQIIGTTKHHFDDVEEAQAAVREIKNKSN